MKSKVFVACCGGGAGAEKLSWGVCEATGVHVVGIGAGTVLGPVLITTSVDDCTLDMKESC